jgi:hypothetical protein
VLGGAEPLPGSWPDGGPSDCIASRTLASEIPSALASAAAGSWPLLGRADCIAFSSALVVTPSLLARALRSGRCAEDGAVPLPLLALLALLALLLLAAPQPAAPTSAVAPTITASLRMRGLLIVMLLVGCWAR